MLRAVDFFCGAGGMTNGLLAAGVDVIAGVDNHLPCKATYENASNNLRPRGSPPTFIDADVASNALASRLRKVGVEAGDDRLILTGCSPCQYWSKVNTSKDKSASSKLLLDHFRTYVKLFRPGYVVVENVAGLSTRRTHSGLEDLLKLLRNLGYGYGHGIVAAYRYGVPQKRRRYILIATRLRIRTSGPAITLPDPSWSGPRYPANMAVDRFIGPDNGFPPLRAGERVDEPSLHWAAALSEKNVRRISMINTHGGSRSAWKDEPDLQIDAYRGRDNIFSDVYGRMRWDEPAPTITTRFVSISNGRFGHPDEHRAISLREGAILQTFDVGYAFPASFPEAARQIGNAVPPVLAERIGDRIMKHYAEVRPS